MSVPKKEEYMKALATELHKPVRKGQAAKASTCNFARSDLVDGFGGHGRMGERE